MAYLLTLSNHQNNTQSAKAAALSLQILPIRQEYECKLKKEAMSAIDTHLPSQSYPVSRGQENHAPE